MASFFDLKALTASISIFPASGLEDSKPATTVDFQQVDETKVRVVTLSEYKAAALSLAEAFFHDPAARYLFDTPDRAHWSEKQKWNLHLSMMEYITYAHCMKGLVLTVGPNYGCVALWMPPGQNMDDWVTILLSGMWRLSYKLSREGKTRFFTEFLPLLHETKLAVLGPELDDKSYYLVYLGTRPAARGLGFARKSVEFVMRRADAEERVCYLECSHEGNLEFYGRLGFEVRKRVSLTRGCGEVTLDAMVREPVVSN